MRILVISDTHGKTHRVFDVYKKLAAEAPPDMIVHCGDYYADAQEIHAQLGVPMVAVKGNCDGCFDFGAYSVLETECGDILIAHGHMEDVGFSMQKLYYKALEQGCVGAFFGHTHRSVFVETGGVYLLNPGSLSLPRDGSGGTFALVVTSETGLWGKIYRYDDFIAAPAGAGSGAHVTGTPVNSGTTGTPANPGTTETPADPGTTETPADPGTTGTPANPGTTESPARGAAARAGSGSGSGAGAGADAPTASKPKTKVKGGHLRGLINYSDRF